MAPTKTAQVSKRITTIAIHSKTAVSRVFGPAPGSATSPRSGAACAAGGGGGGPPPAPQGPSGAAVPGRRQGWVPLAEVLAQVGQDVVWQTLQVGRDVGTLQASAQQICRALLQV